MFYSSGTVEYMYTFIIFQVTNTFTFWPSSSLTYKAWLRLVCADADLEKVCRSLLPASQTRLSTFILQTAYYSLTFGRNERSSD